MLLLIGISLINCYTTVLHYSYCKTNGQNKEVLRLSAWGMVFACFKNFGKFPPQRSYKKNKIQLYFLKELRDGDFT